jgi:hypothetical protein
MKSLEELGVSKDLGLRFNLVGFVPTALLALLVLALVASGLPNHDPDPGRILRAAGQLSGTQLVVVFLVVLVLSLILYPFQLSLVRLLEGYWEATGFGTAMAAIRIEVHRRERERLLERAYTPLSPTTGTPTSNALEEERLQRVARRRLESGYPPDEERLLPTRLGNALRAFEDQVGQRYGLETVVVFPRLTPYLSDPVRAALDDLRDQLDIAARLCVTLLLATVLSGVLLLAHGWWLVLPATTALLAWVAYRSAIQAAVAYGEEVAVAFDLHRFEMLRGLHFALPDAAAAELTLNEQVSRFLAERRSLEDLSPGDYPDYDHPSEDGANQQLVLMRSRVGLELLLRVLSEVAGALVAAFLRFRRTRGR